MFSLNIVYYWLTLQIFRDGADKTDQPGGAILSNTDSRMIFDKIPPILEVHEEIMRDLELLLDNWSDDLPVANVILSKVSDIRKYDASFSCCSIIF